MPHITPDGKRLVLSVEDLNERGPFSIEFPSGEWIELTIHNGDVLLDLDNFPDMYEQEPSIFVLQEAAVDTTQSDEAIFNQSED